MSPFWSISFSDMSSIGVASDGGGAGGGANRAGGGGVQTAGAEGAGAGAGAAAAGAGAGVGASGGATGGAAAVCANAAWDIEDSSDTARSDTGSFFTFFRPLFGGAR